MLESFEERDNKSRNLANIILLKVENDEKDMGAGGEDSKESGYIVGGYASHGWSASFNQRGDDSCFLFNMT